MLSIADNSWCMYIIEQVSNAVLKLYIMYIEYMFNILYSIINRIKVKDAERKWAYGCGKLYNGEK